MGKDSQVDNGGVCMKLFILLISFLLGGTIAIFCVIIFLLPIGIFYGMQTRLWFLELHYLWTYILISWIIWSFLLYKLVIPKFLRKWMVSE